jgi:hypothetical protein
MLLICCFAVKSRFALWYTLCGFLSCRSFPPTLCQLVPPQRSSASIIVKPAGVSDADPRITSSRTVAWLLQALLPLVLANGLRLPQLTITLILVILVAILAILEEGQPWIRLLTVCGGLILQLAIRNRVLFLCSVIFITLALAFPLFYHTSARVELFWRGG